MSATDTTEVQCGLEGVVAFATDIAEPDKEGGALRYRGVDIEDLVGRFPYEKVWGLLGRRPFDPGSRPPCRTRCRPHRRPRVDVQAALASSPQRGASSSLDIDDARRATTSPGPR